jgi:diguanylate cyclase (GGDEF)-like protein/PAS domain S-box-containing protein
MITNSKTLKMLLLMLIVGLFIPLYGSIFATSFFPEFFWNHQPVYLLIESLGVIAALLIAILLLALRQQVQNYSSVDYFWIASALIAMSILSGFHAVAQVGNNFLWFRGSSLIVGGVIISLSWLKYKGPAPDQSDALLFFIIGITCLFGLFSNFNPELIPRMTEGMTLSGYSRNMNIAGGVLFYLASVHFIKCYIRENNFDLFLFAMLSLIFGSAGLSFAFCEIWDISWWWSHVLKLLTYVIAFLFFITYYLSLERSNKQKREHLVLVVNELEEQIKKNSEERERFLLYVQATGDGMWDWKLDTNEFYFSDKWKSMLGYDTDEIKGSFIEWQDLVHPDDLGKVLKMWITCTEGANNYNIEYRIKNKSGNYIWVSSRTIALINENGEVCRLAGSQTDITAEKDALLQLKEYQKNLEYEIEERTHDLKEANKRLRDLASIDGLTGLKNRRSFDESIDREWNRCKRDRSAFSLIMLDIDYFKQYNDTYGHLEGDNVLKRFAGALMKTVRRSTDIVARYGGEEFSVILSGTDEDQALKVAKNIQDHVHALKIPAASNCPNPYVTFSVGVGTIRPGEDNSWQAVLEQVDRALYRAKELGRDRIIVSEMNITTTKNSHGH